MLLRFLFLPLLVPRLPRSTLFPYTTLFRSRQEFGQIVLTVAVGVCSGTSGRVRRRAKIVCLPLLVRRRSEEHTSELQSLTNLVCRLLLEKKKRQPTPRMQD